MKKIAVLPLVCGLAVASHASAMDYVFDFGTVLITPANPQNQNATLSPGAGWEVVGFTFDGYYTYSHSFFATDARLDIYGPGGFHFAVGGYDNYSGNPWQFGDGEGQKTHSAGIGPVNANGDWTVVVSNDWSPSAGHPWSNLTVTLHMVPAPGSLALLGLAGAAAFRRRR